jgi:hypothetical protein
VVEKKIICTIQFWQKQRRRQTEEFHPAVVEKKIICTIQFQQKQRRR